MFTSLLALKILIITLFAFLLIILLVKEKFLNDYTLIFILFLGVCVFSQALFHKGYPLERELLPLYPIIVMIIINALKYLLKYTFANPILFIGTCILILQFFIKIDFTKTKDWADNYIIREEIYNYVISNNLDENRNDFYIYIDNFHNETANFYKGKIDLSDNIEENRPDLWEDINKIDKDKIKDLLKAICP
jgi:hypothetical protein